VNEQRGTCKAKRISYLSGEERIAHYAARIGGIEAVRVQLLEQEDVLPHLIDGLSQAQREARQQQADNTECSYLCPIESQNRLGHERTAGTLTLVSSPTHIPSRGDFTGVSSTPQRRNHSDWRVVVDSDVNLEDQLYFFLPRCPVCSDYLDDCSRTVQNLLYRLYEQLLESKSAWEAQVIMDQVVREAFQGRLPSRGDFNGASSAPKAKSFPLPHFGGRSAFQREDPLGYPDTVHSACTQQYLHLGGLPSPSRGIAQPLPHFSGRSAPASTSAWLPRSYSLSCCWRFEEAFQGPVRGRPCLQTL
jgi:hypothetical protein